MFRDYNELEDFVRLNQHNEQRNCEFKGNISWNDPEQKHKIVKAILSMTNLRDGGYFIIGVAKTSNVDGYQLIGVTRDVANTYNHDNVSALANSFSRSNINIQLKLFDKDDKFFVVIQVSEFSNVPAICGKDYGEILHAGRIYGRPSRQPESSDNLSVEDVDEILELAVEKRFRRRQTFFERVGYVQQPPISQTPPQPNAKELFRQESENF